MAVERFAVGAGCIGCLYGCRGDVGVSEQVAAVGCVIVTVSLNVILAGFDSVAVADFVAGSAHCSGHPALQHVVDHPLPPGFALESA